ncbi:MAG: GNAT family N-acetyltransferase [Chloroflexi bacterium]|nr:GNAT family N-acetyltransferase [Chloroflexota bacterium]
MIRIATEADLPAIVAIYNAAVPGRMATADTEPVTVESRRAWFTGHSPDRHPLWVDEREGEVVGWLSLGTFYNRPAWDITAEVSVYVTPAHQRHGVAVGLLENALAEAPALGLRALIGIIFGHNDPSLALFRRFGFEDWGLMPRVTELDNVERDVVFVGRRVEGA